MVPSRVQLLPGPWDTVLEALTARFPHVGTEIWRDRMQRGLVQDAHAVALDELAGFRAGIEIRYWREVRDEPTIAVQETVLHADAHLVVADKPHGLPVMAGGRSATETLLARLVRQFDNPDLVPLHRIDRDTAGLVMFSASRESRARYHALFRERRVEKAYEAVAPPLRDLVFPVVRRSRMQRGEPFFRMREVAGEPNAETVIERTVEATSVRGSAHAWTGSSRVGWEDSRGTEIAEEANVWRYSLRPVTGRKHQLRVHMAALGAPIQGDCLYPVLRVDQGERERASELKLLAKTLQFVDPIDGTARYYESRLFLADTG